MNEKALFSALDMALLVVGGAVLALVLLGARYSLRFIPMGRSVRAVVNRITPIIGLAFAIGYVGFVVRRLFREDKELVSALLALLIVALVALGWGSIRDFVAGVVVKAGQVVRTGDYIRVGDVEGRVVALGYRVVVVKTTDGDEAVVPYIQISRGLVQRSQALEGACVHVFSLDVPHGSQLGELKRTAREAALRCHWSSAVYSPKFERTDDGKLEVTVFALHPDYAPDIEAAVRDAAELEPAANAPPTSAPKPPQLRL